MGETMKSVTVLQRRDFSKQGDPVILYIVEKTVNTLSVEIGQTIGKKQIEDLIADDIKVVIT